MCTAACPHLSGYDGDHISDVSVDGGNEDWFSRGCARPHLRLYPPCSPCDIMSDDSWSASSQGVRVCSPLYEDGLQRVCEFGGLERWNGMVEWSTGLDYWSAMPTNIQLAWSVMARSKLFRPIIYSWLD